MEAITTKFSKTNGKPHNIRIYIPEKITESFTFLPRGRTALGIALVPMRKNRTNVYEGDPHGQFFHDQ